MHLTGVHLPFILLFCLAQLPQVHVVLMPRDPEAWLHSLLYAAWPLVRRRTSATREDTSRTQLYEEQMQRQDATSRAASLADLLASLKVQVDVDRMAAVQAARLAQLTERTNQFNGARREPIPSPLLASTATPPLHSLYP